MSEAPSRSAAVAGGWLFSRRGWLPVPLLAAMFLRPTGHWIPGVLLVALGEGVRLAAVGHIGRPSRTRGPDVGPLVRGGLYACVRNPLYIGNILIFAGIGVVLWPSALVAVPLLAAYYQAIVRWEEANLDAQLGAPYRAYRDEVPRWIPRLPPGGSENDRWNLRIALGSERSTLLALLAVSLLLAARSVVGS